MAKVYAVMLFYPEWDLGISDARDKFVHTKTVDFGVDKIKALDYYADMPCPASQFIEGEDFSDLRNKETEMKTNFKNPEWVTQLMERL